MTCECPERVTLDCECSVCSSDCVAVDGSGNGTELTFSPTLDPAVSNLLTCVPGDGFLAILPDTILNPPYCIVNTTGAQSIPNDFGTRVQFDGELEDSDSMHSNVTNNERVTFNTAGLYTVSFAGEFAAGSPGSVGDRGAHIRKNGSEFIGGSSRFALVSTTLVNGLNVSCQEAFEAGEYIEVLVKQDNGGALNLMADAMLSVRYRRSYPT